MRVYLDNCCFNRPFDDQRQPRIRLEAEAKLYLQENIRAGILELAWSYILDFENQANPYEERRRAIAEWKHQATFDVEETEAILQKAHTLTELGLKPKDALHLACALESRCDYFVTTEDHILRRRTTIEGITVLDPPGLIREMDP